MNHLDFILDTKAVTEDGQIEGLAAGYGNIDAGGDVIVPGALARSLIHQIIAGPSMLGRREAVELMVEELSSEGAAP